MEVDETQKQVSIFQRINCVNSTNPNKIATKFPDGGRWPSSRIVRVSRASGGKDRHSKVLTSKGLRDRRVRLSVTTAIQFYDLQERLGFDQPSKAVEWLIKATASSIAELPSLDPEFEFVDPNYYNKHKNQNNNNVSLSSSTSETSKGLGLSLSRSEKRVRARERARIMATKKEKESNGVLQNGSFTDLLTGGISSSTVSSNHNASPKSRIHWTNQTNYFQMPQFNQDQHQHQHQHFSFLQENFAPGGGLGSGLNRGTLQSNILLSSLPHQQRFQQSSMVDGSTSTSTNFQLFVAPDHFPATAYYGGGDDGGRYSDHHMEKSNY